MTDTESLPDDGATYPCSYAFSLYEDWRCSKVATVALSVDMAETFDRVKTKYEHMHGRAVCDTHLKLVADRVDN